MLVTGTLAVGSLYWFVDTGEVVVPGGLAVVALGWLVESDKDVPGGLVVVPLDLLVDKSVLGHNSAEGKGIPHADQRAGLVALGKELYRFTQHPIVDLTLFRAVWQVWVHPCVKFGCRHSEFTAPRYDEAFEMVLETTPHNSSFSVTLHRSMKKSYSS